MVLDAFGRNSFVLGGPYEDKCKEYPDAFGINLADEIKDVAHVELGIRDFSTPTKSTLRIYRKVAEDAVVRVLRREQVYVGCFMGQGRTGTFLAVMAKMCGYPQPIEFVRATYNEHAVETVGQEKFVEGFGVTFSRIRIALRLKFGKR
jgi:protein-tyrosine phosphatase